MKTIILPGYSNHNKEWAEEIANDLGQGSFAHSWKHWESGSFSLKRELDNIIKEVGDEKVNIIAKSVGVFVTLNLIPKIPDQIKRVVLCGIASVASEDRKELLKETLKMISFDNILCIQNENDKYVPFKEAVKFYHSVEPKLKVISKPRSDHHYPYPEEFRAFLNR